MTTRKDQAKLRRLELENARLREQLDRHMKVYSDQLHELVDLRTRLDLITEAIGEST